MTIKDAAALLADLPQVQAIEVAVLKPGAVIVVESAGALSPHTVERLQNFMNKIWPDHKVVVLGDGLKMKIIDPTHG